jgi:hypothetical protein
MFSELKALTTEPKNKLMVMLVHGLYGNPDGYKVPKGLPVNWDCFVYKYRSDKNNPSQNPSHEEIVQDLRNVVGSLLKGDTDKHATPCEGILFQGNSQGSQLVKALVASTPEIRKSTEGLIFIVPPHMGIGWDGYKPGPGEPDYKPVSEDFEKILNEVKCKQAAGLRAGEPSITKIRTQFEEVFGGMNRPYEGPKLLNMVGGMDEIVPRSSSYDVMKGLSEIGEEQLGQTGKIVVPGLKHAEVRWNWGDRAVAAMATAINQEKGLVIDRVHTPVEETVFVSQDDSTTEGLSLEGNITRMPASTTEQSSTRAVNILAGYEAARDVPSQSQGTGLASDNPAVRAQRQGELGIATARSRNVGRGCRCVIL